MKAKGRVTPDYSFYKKEGGQINTETVKQSQAQNLCAIYGEIKAESIEDIMQRVMRMAEQEGRVNLILFKMDLKGAFYLIFKFFKADDVGLRHSR